MIAAKKRCLYWARHKDTNTPYLIRLEASDVLCAFWVYEPVTHDIPGEAPQFRPSNWLNGTDGETWRPESVSVVSGFIKWDGCLEFSSDDHICDGPKGYSVLHDTTQAMFALAHSAMTGPNNLMWKPMPGYLDKFTMEDFVQ